MTRAHHKIFLDQSSQNARQILESRPEFEIINQQDLADLLWIRKNHREITPQKSQLFNHFKNETLITQKGDLTDTLKPYPDSYIFYPESYRLNNKSDRQKFFDQIPNQDNKDNLWVLKPNSLSRGRGIKIVWQLNDLKNNLNQYASPKDDYIIQRHVKDILLLKKRKSELRVYWLIASLEPLTVFIYPEGTVRLTTQKFKLDDFDNPLRHITNLYQQKKFRRFFQRTPDKWNFEMLDHYVCKKLRLAEKGWTKEFLFPKLQNSIGCVARAFRARFSDISAKQPGRFGLYGADFILDQHLNPWLTEIQKGPGLAFDDPVKSKIIPNMFAEALNITLEIKAKKLAGENPTKLCSIKRFEWVHR